MGKSATSILKRVARIGSDPADSDEIKLQKSLLVLCSFPFMFAGAGWGIMYIMFDETLAGMIPLSYSIISLLSMVHFAFTRRLRIFRFSQLLLILLLPFSLMLALGGFINGSAVILWGLIAPLGALLFDKPKHAPVWFLAFLFLVVLSGFLQSYLSSSNNLTLTQIILFFVINISGVGSLIFLMVYYFVGQKNVFEQKSETLLLNILPRDVVTILKQGSRTIADHYEGASILFADVVNFTPLSARMTPAELVELLNEVFSKFDLLVEKYGLEKIKTIGDCYMIASGVPRPRADHAVILTNMAVEMRDTVMKKNFLGHKLGFRIGINSGPVVAGVIGRNKFSYDLWGDAVNIASRMESHGREGMIQITDSTYELIKEEFVCTPHGEVEVKGKGQMRVWFVIKKNDSSLVTTG